MRTLKKKKIPLLIMILTLGIIGCAFKCSDVYTQGKGDNYYPISIKTYDYKKQLIELTFYEAPNKVFAQDESSIDTLLALGLEDKLIYSLEKEDDIMSGQYCLFNDKQLEGINCLNNIAVKRYISLNNGINIEKTLNNELCDILNLGKIFNVEDKANEIVREIEETVDSILELSKNMEPKKVIIIEFCGSYIYTYSSNTLSCNIIKEIGGELLNPLGGNISMEELINLNPDYIFYVYRGAEDTYRYAENLKSILENKNTKVYPISLEELQFRGVKVIDEINKFADILYRNN